MSAAMMPGLLKIIDNECVKLVQVGLMERRRETYVREGHRFSLSFLVRLAASDYESPRNARG